MIRSLTLAALLLGAVPHAYAQAFVSGAQLARACTGRSPADANSCDGYIAGTLDAVRDTAEYKGQVCPPTGVRLSAMREGIAKFAPQHGDATRGPGVDLVVAFIKATYPCGK